jgi:hypothetical protein
MFGEGSERAPGYSEGETARWSGQMSICYYIGLNACFGKAAAIDRIGANVVDLKFFIILAGRSS